MEFKDEEERYAALCAYVLGEAEPQEREAIEQALAESPELRKQRDEIEATIGLVKTSIGGGETLSEAATDDLLQRATAIRPRWRVLRSSPWMAAAAGIGAITLGLFAYRTVGTQQESVGESSLSNTELAKLGQKKDRHEWRNEMFGDAPAEVEQQLSPDAGERADHLALLDGAERAGEAGGRAYERSSKAAADERLGTLPNRNAPQAEERAQAGLEFEGDAPALRDRELDRKMVDALESLGYSQDDGASAPAVSEEPPLDLGLSLSAIDQDGIEPAEAELARRARVKAVGGDAGKWKGPGDTVAPATHAAEPSTPAAQGPAAPGAPGASARPLSPGPAGPSGPMTVAGSAGASGRYLYRLSKRQGAALPPVQTGSGDYFIGRGEGRVPASQPTTKNEVQKLRDLGYVAEPPAKEGVPPELRGLLAGLGYVGEDERFGGQAGRRRNFSKLSEVERENLVAEWCRVIVERCRRRPGEHPRDMFFRYYGDNPFELAAIDPLSTFGVDVDTASYTLARNYLERGMIPPKAQVRTEEFVNYFAPDVPAPLEETFAIRTELAPSRFGDDSGRWMMSVALRGREVAREERKPLALTFVVDTSGSMKQERRMEMVKHALRLLLAELDGQDTVALVGFSNEARLILPPTSTANRGLIESAIHPLAPDGGTNAEAGLIMGFEVALSGLRSGANNRVVFLSDGVANIGQTDQDRVNDTVTRHRKQGIYLNTIGVGMGNHNDVFLEQLANKGDGVCNYIDSPAEARRALVDNFTGQFETIARDVKIQVEFDPLQVHRYRLLGYENRAIADKDFRNDLVDAGEIGAGHQVVALYEIERTMSAGDGPLATVRVRWKPPYAAGLGRASLAAGEEASEVEHQVQAASAVGFEGASPGFRRAAIVAQFAEFLRRSKHARNDSFDEMIAEAERLQRQLSDADFDELVVLLHQSRALILQSIPDCDDLCQTIDEVRRRNLRRAELQLLDVERDAQLLAELERQNAELEARIRELVRRKLEQGGR